MKYIMFETTPENDNVSPEPRFIPIIFPKELIHFDVAAAVLYGVLRKHNIDASVRSAGEILLMKDDFECVGESETLHVKAHPDDTDIIRLNDYCHGLASTIEHTKEIISRIDEQILEKERSRDAS